MTTILLAVALWLVWRFAAMPASTTSYNLRAMAYSLAPVAALAIALAALLRAPWAAKRHFLMEIFSSTGTAPAEAPAPLQLSAASEPPFQSMTVKQLRALARLQGFSGRLISHSSKAALIAILS